MTDALDKLKNHKPTTGCQFGKGLLICHAVSDGYDADVEPLFRRSRVSVDQCPAPFIGLNNRRCRPHGRRRSAEQRAGRTGAPNCHRFTASGPGEFQRIQTA